jgi:frataxin
LIFFGELHARMDDSEFALVADRTLARLAQNLEAALEADDPDIDLAHGILTVELADGRTFIANKHQPTRQIWLSSPVSGASHYAYDASTDAWRSTRGPQTLAAQFGADLAECVGHSVALG